jgi:lipopolysaccharide export system protein LptA
MTGVLKISLDALRPLAVAVALAGAVLNLPSASAQTLTNAFGGLSQSSGDPIDIESDALVVHDKEKYATFRGKVKAVQGTTTLRAKELNVHYIGGASLAPGNKEGGAATSTKVADAKGGGEAAKGDQAQITKIEAKGEVVITSDKDQTTTSEWALYDVTAQMVTVGGNVVLTQGQNVLKGDRLIIDLKTGESRFENTGNEATGGRIRALFMPKDAVKGGDQKDAKPADAKAAAPGEKAAGSGNKPDKDKGAAAEQDEPSDEEAPWPLTPDTP